MSRRHTEQSERLIIFSRYPVPGLTKTRLIPELGKAGAADLQRRLTEATLRTAREFASLSHIGIEVRFEGGSEYQMRQWLGHDVLFSRQTLGSLGNRMQVSFEEAFQEGRRHVVLIGSDIPALGRDHLKKAFAAFKKYDLVIGPSPDGGYWLIGMKGPNDVFYGVDWGTDAVFDQTMGAAKKIGLQTAVLDSLSDIDTFADLKNQDDWEVDKKPYISVIIPAFNEEANIEKTIFSAYNQDAEVIVVDGGSSDNTVKKAIAAGARVQTCGSGRAVQQNFGAAFAQGRVVLFLHADTLLPEDYVDHVFEAFMDPETVAGAFKFKTDWNRPMMRVVEFFTNLRSKHLNLPYGDQGLFVRKSAFEANGGFPLVSIAEDLFFIRSVAKKRRIRTVSAEAVTSARRWQRLGIFRVTLINLMIVAGCFIGISPRLLATLCQGEKFKPRRTRL
jgi:rSAM/selenodomain-associated transferase 2/rSAM/selenodomain-associated transferase 1